MRIIFLFTLLSIFQWDALAQLNYAPISIKADDLARQIPALEKKFKHVRCDSVFKPALFAALEYYDTLHQLKIRVVAKKRMHHFMNVRPTFMSVFKRKSKRVYKIRVNQSDSSEVPLPDYFTFNALIGAFGHELAHIADYNNAGIGKLIRFAFMELSPNQRKLFEEGTDLKAIQKGLGWQLYDFISQVERLSHYEEYRTRKEKYYIGSKEMLGILLDYGYQ